MKKRMIIIPHSIWATLLIILTITCYCMYGGPAYSFIDPWVFPLLFLWMFPLPTSISALGIMIIALTKKEKEHTKLLISSGIIGSIVLFFYLVAFFGISVEISSGIITAFYDLALFVTPFLALTIWILWLIYRAKTKNNRKTLSGYKYVKKEK